jgi:phosphinothricin acetyltransferase
MLIRLALPTDGPRLAAIYEPAVVDSFLSIESTAPSGVEMSRRIMETTTHRPWLVAESDIVLGYAYASAHRVRPAYGWSVEVSIYTAPEAHRQGLGRALYTTLFAVLTLQGYQNAYAGVTVPNPASSAFHEAMGFQVIGTYPRVGYKLGRWVDVRWYGRSLGGHPADPAPPRALPDIIGAPEFEQALRAGQRDR